MNEQDIKSIAQFFSLVLLDDEAASNISRRLIKKLKKLWTSDESVDKEASLISECYREWKALINVDSKNDDYGRITGSSVSSDDKWTIPKNISFEPWKKFLQLERPDNVFAMLWTEILGKSEEKTAKALRVSVGTIRTRVAISLQNLGAHCLTENIGV